jgi:Transposase DDE domain group 1
MFLCPNTEGFRVNAKIQSRLEESKRRIDARLDKNDLSGAEEPMYTASNIHYEQAERTRGISHGGIGSIHLLARQIGLIDAINNHLHVLKIHLPFHESDHVLNLAYNPLCGGTCLEDIELRRNDEVFLDALGARRIPDPTTAGDFCRRFKEQDIWELQAAYDEARLNVWATQPARFFKQATIDMDGTLVGTAGNCKEGMDIAYEGTWGYHPLVFTLAETGEVLSLINRSGNRPSHEGAAAEVDRRLAFCFSAGFRKALLRGDTDFSQTEHLDRWNANPRVRFIFGYNSLPNLEALANDLGSNAWKKLLRPERYEVKTKRRQRPDNVKEKIVRERKFDVLRLKSEEVAEFTYRPIACATTYRMIVVRKNVSNEKGEQRLLDEIRYFFYLTNDWTSGAADIVFLANDRCNQENLLAQLKGGCRALQAPVDNLLSNWAYMMMTALAWNLKAWWGLKLREPAGRSHEQTRSEKKWVLRLEFKKFVQAFVQIPCQIVRTGRRIVFRLLCWNAHQGIFFRLLDALG